MKKVILALFCFLFYSNFSLAYETSTVTNGKFEPVVQKIGYNLLNSNKIPYRATFFIHKKENTIDIHWTKSDRRIILYKEVLNYIKDDDELAAVLAQQIAHVVESNKGILKGFFTPLSYGLASKKYDLKADKLGVDYMVKAGYNPLAMIVVLNKLGNQKRYELFSSHPLTSKRMMEVYEYIYVKYPEFLVDNKKYENDLIYQNFLLTSKENRKKLQSKIKSNSTKNIKYE